MTTHSQPRSTFLTVNGLRLHYLDWGNAGAPPVVCVHGYTSSAEAFNALARHFQDRFHLIVPDVRGHGESAWSICAYLRPLSPTYPSRHLLLTAEAWARSLCQPCPHSAFLMPPTPRSATQKAAQTREAHLEAGLRPTALYLLPQRV